LPPIRVGESSQIRPCFWFRRRAIPSKEPADRPPEAEQRTDWQTQTVRLSRDLENSAHVRHGSRGPAAGKGNAPDIVQRDIAKKAVSAKREAKVLLC